MHKLTVEQFKEYAKSKKIKLGILESKTSFKIHNDFKMTDEELLKS